MGNASILVQRIFCAANASERSLGPNTDSMVAYRTGLVIPCSPYLRKV